MYYVGIKYLYSCSFYNGPIILLSEWDLRFNNYNLWVPLDNGRFYVTRFQEWWCSLNFRVVGFDAHTTIWRYYQQHPDRALRLLERREEFDYNSFIQNQRTWKKMNVIDKNYFVNNSHFFKTPYLFVPTILFNVTLFSIFIVSRYVGLIYS